MTYQTTFDLEVLIKSCAKLRESVCDDGEMIIDKCIALAKKNAVDGKLTFTKRIVKNMDRYADVIDSTSVNYIFDDEDEFSSDVRLCIWALSPKYVVGRLRVIGDSVEMLRWVAEHYPERFADELEHAVTDRAYSKRVKCQDAFPTHPLVLEHVRSFGQVLEAHEFDATSPTCIKDLYAVVDRFGHGCIDNNIATLIYKHLDTLFDNDGAFTDLVAGSGYANLTTIFKSPKAYTQYWDRFTARGMETEDRNGVKTVLSYNKWFIDMSIEIRGFLSTLNDMYDIYLPSETASASIVSKHYEICGTLPLEDKVYFTDLPLTAVQSLYSDFKVKSFREFINGKPVNEPIIIAYPERRTMAHVLIKGNFDKLQVPSSVNHPTVYVGWPAAYTKGHLNIVEYDGAIEVVARCNVYEHRFGGSFAVRDEPHISDLYLDSSDKPYSLDRILKEDIGDGKVKFDPSGLLDTRQGYGRNGRTMMGGSFERGMTMPRIWNDVYLGGINPVGMPRQHGKSLRFAQCLHDYMRETFIPKSDNVYHISKEVKLTPLPVQYPTVNTNTSLYDGETERYAFSMGRLLTTRVAVASNVLDIADLYPKNHILY